MKIDKKKFPILGCLTNNILTDKFQNFIDTQTTDELAQRDILKSVEFFKEKKLQINYISKTIHDKLIDNNNFIKAKSLLKNSPTSVGLILLPTTIYPDFSNVPKYIDIDNNDYPINAILYSWRSVNEHDKITGDYEAEDPWDDKDRMLLILPIFDDGTTQGTKFNEMINSNETYGWDYSLQEDRAWYGKIHDYVMSFILFYNYTETETHIIHGTGSGKFRRLKIKDEKFINDTTNNVEIIDVNYFTKIIRTGEFEVNGHFKVQHFGIGNNEAKIIYIDDYKKKGYTRNAKIDNK